MIQVHKYVPRFNSMDRYFNANKYFLLTLSILSNDRPHFLHAIIYCHTNHNMYYQSFLQAVVRLSSVDPRSPLHRETSKDALLAAFPFFGEDTLAMNPVCDLDNLSGDWQQLGEE